MSINFLSSINANKILSGTTCVISPVIYGTNCVTAPVVVGTTCVCTPIVCATNVCGSNVCGTNCVSTYIANVSNYICTPIVSASNYITAPVVYGTTCVCTPIVCASNYTCTPILRASNYVTAPIVSGTTCINTPILKASNCATVPVITGTSSSGAVCIGGANVCILNGNNLALVAGSSSSFVDLRYYGSTKLITTSYGVCVCNCICAVTCGVSPDWVATSDCRLKKDIEPIYDALSIVSQLRGVYYRLCDDYCCERNVGLIAQEVYEVIPEIVSHSKITDNSYEKYGIKDEVLGLKYDKLTALLIEAVKEQQEQINYLKEKLNSL